MKSMNNFTKIFFICFLFTLSFLILTIYSGKKAFETDPYLSNKLAKQYNIKWSTQGFSINQSGSQSHHSTETSPAEALDKNISSFYPPQNKIILKIVAANVHIITSNVKEIKISAASHSMEAQMNDTELIINEIINEIPTDTKDQEVNIEIPVSFKKDLEIINVSGNVKMNLKESKINSLSSHTVSGNVDLELSDFNNYNFNLKSVSGNIQNSHKQNPHGTHPIEITTTSGNISVK